MEEAHSTGGLPVNVALKWGLFELDTFKDGTSSRGLQIQEAVVGLFVCDLCTSHQGQLLFKTILCLFSLFFSRDHVRCKN